MSARGFNTEGRMRLIQEDCSDFKVLRTSGYISVHTNIYGPHFRLENDHTIEEENQINNGKLVQFTVLHASHETGQREYPFKDPLPQFGHPFFILLENRILTATDVRVKIEEKLKMPLQDSGGDKWQLNQYDYCVRSFLRDADTVNMQKDPKLLLLVHRNPLAATHTYAQKREHGIQIRSLGSSHD